jgi:hypothetical protein
MPSPTLAKELKIIDDVRQLKARYFRFLDTKDWEGFGTIFCRDATFDLRAAATLDPNDGSAAAAASAQLMLKGRDAIVSVIRDSVGDSTTVHHGHCHEVWVDSADAARGIIAMVDIIRNPHTGALILEGYGHYHETYRREDGAWRISASRLSRLLVTSNLDAK